MCRGQALPRFRARNAWPLAAIFKRWRLPISTLFWMGPEKCIIKGAPL